MYQGSDSKCTINNLEPNTHYLLRIAAVRHCEDGDLIGNFSPSTAFCTPVMDIAPQALVTAPQTISHNERRTVYDRYTAFGLVCISELLCFFLATILASFLDLHQA